MYKSLLILSLIFLSIQTVEARPSIRTLRENAEQYSENDAGWRMKFFSWEEYGLRVTHAESWREPVILTHQSSTDETVFYDYARIMPHDNTLGQRKNYLLELTTLAWNVGKELDTNELEAFARSQTPPRYREFYFLDAKETELAGHPAWNFRISSMTGQREETWISVGPYVYTIGYRARNTEYFEADHFFYEDFLSSVKITPIEVPEVAKVSGANDDLIFSDIPDTHPYYSAIIWSKENGIVGGYPDGTFQPDRTVNRVEFLKIILGAANADTTGIGVPDFPDIDLYAWYAPFIAYAQVFGIVQGYPDSTFQPEKTVNTAEALKMAYKALDVQTSASNGPWYQPYLDHAEVHNILFESLDPAKDLKRKDVVWIVWQLSQ
ncbi:MAG: S-layer homology domain-containing protein [Candidatus Peribacteraceae bacterium]|nr:S-layer homology domain-containing protein [Candidatus Peribacteraceae bacterium]|tara:strand:- start:21852 stop:22988 length:1137 start_codon:yes stop_codon:yes gene_type:complete